MLLTDARRAARTGPDGRLVPLTEQDRSAGTAARSPRATALVADTLAAAAQLGPYQLQAAIAAVHAEAPRAAGHRLAADPRPVRAARPASRPSPMVTLNRRGRGRDGGRARGPGWRLLDAAGREPARRAPPAGRRPGAPAGDGRRRRPTARDGVPARRPADHRLPERRYLELARGPAGLTRAVSAAPGRRSRRLGSDPCGQRRTGPAIPPVPRPSCCPVMVSAMRGTLRSVPDVPLPDWGDGVSSESSPTARALLALELLQGSPGITADRLADKLGVSERAARRYVGILREAGIPIESVRGPYGGYRVGRGLRLPPLMFSATEALGLVMAVLDGHHDASDPTDPVGSALGKIVRALPEAVAAQAEAVRRTAAPAPDRGRRPARPGHHGRAGAGLLEPPAGPARLPVRGRHRSGTSRSTRGRSWSGTAGGTCCAGRTAPTRGGRTGSTGSARVRGARRHLQPAGRPRPGRRARGASRRRLGVRRSRSSSTHRWTTVARCLPRTLGRLEPLDAGHHPAGRQHQQPDVVRRAARADPGAVPDRGLPGGAGGRPRARPAAAGRGGGLTRMSLRGTWRRRCR